ncbi:hypothetical protein FRB93_000321 [Tulasnella sp. JGI-2019a]|nr:hypothetical protein FRB93_000321 [Tulasnella sp. JGI-2019a]
MGYNPRTSVILIAFYSYTLTLSFYYHPFLDFLPVHLSVSTPLRFLHSLILLLMRIDLYAIGLVNLLAISCALAAPLPVIYSTYLTKRIGGPAVEGAVAKSNVFRKIGQAFKSGMKRLRPKTKFKPTAKQFGAEIGLILVKVPV